MKIADQIHENKAEQAALGIPAKKRGVTVTVLSREGEELAVSDTLRANSRSMQLLKVRRGADAQGSRGHDRAVYYVGEKSIETLENNLLSYENWEDQGRSLERYSLELANEPRDASDRRPRNFWLFESAASFKIAKVEDLWTDALENFPREKGAVEWEIWIRDQMKAAFDAAVEQLGIKIYGRPSKFVDILVYNGFATKAAISRLVAQSAAVVELRGASNFIAQHADLPPPKRLAQIQSIAQRVVPPPNQAPWVTLLDTGVNPASSLIAPALPTERCRTITSAWDSFDSDGHGSKMAGIALYGDLENVASGNDPIYLEVGLESMAVFNPKSTVRIPGRDAIRRGVDLAESKAAHSRVYCLAATAVGELEDGRPTSTSSTLDDLAFGDGKNTRLFCVAVGNVHTTATEPYQVSSYHTFNEQHGIQSPAQALNVLSVGALTNKCSGPSPLADAGGLSPRSRTAQSWEARRHKPDILMEGGNHGIDPGGKTSRPYGPDMIATTSNDPIRKPITLTGDTSAACAAAARLAGRVMARYPAMRPETVRGLLVHCADWTPTMRARREALIAGGMPEEYANLATLDCFGWGVPNEERLFWSAGNALTLIAEDDLQPYERNPGKGVTLKEMKSFRLPWPDKALTALGATEIELRCTLSYFVQPDPHSAGLERLQQYPSHRLQFDFQRFEESERRAQRRVNRAISAPEPAGEDLGWLLGPKRRTRGTLHHDVWRGPAYQLVGRRMINVTPIRGWWATNQQVSPENVPVRFSLIVSIRTPETTNDLVTEVRNLIPARVLIDMPSVIRT
ncbi:S8 family peptidase [Azospirillum oryzae]|uniref:S8 family peptidase n=1 Tax=Azospirillum oryzae TaxID=286727 RepID=UPI00142DA25E|nr:S8 family peptidase [Azospirillum oryzae]